MARKLYQTNVNRGFCSVVITGKNTKYTHAITTQVQVHQIYTLMYVIYKVNCSGNLQPGCWVQLIKSKQNNTVVGQPHALVVSGNTLVAVHFIFILSLTEFIQQFIPKQALAWTYNDLIIIRVASDQDIPCLNQFLTTITAQHKKARGGAPVFILYTNIKPMDELQLQQAKQYSYNNMCNFGDKYTCLYYDDMLHRGDCEITSNILQAIVDEYKLLTTPI